MESIFHPAYGGTGRRPSGPPLAASTISVLCDTSLLAAGYFIRLPLIQRMQHNFLIDWVWDTLILHR
jgi:hypothetical protein